MALKVECLPVTELLYRRARDAHNKMLHLFKACKRRWLGKSAGMVANIDGCNFD